MSDSPNWKELGQQVQHASDLTTSAREEKLRREAAENQARESEEYSRLIVLWARLDALKSECLNIVDNFNSGVSSYENQLVLTGDNVNGFSVRKYSGYPRVEFGTDQNVRILVERKQNDRNYIGGASAYYPDESGGLTTRDGLPTVSAESVARDALVWLTRFH